MARTVLVTGVGRYLGARVAARLAEDRSLERVIGVDSHAARPELAPSRLEFVRADVSHPLIATVLEQAGVDTVVHLGADATADESAGLVDACEHVPGLRRLVVASTTDVYGGSRRDPAVFAEVDGPCADIPTATGRRAVVLERALRAVGRRRPELAVTALRLAGIVGPGADSWWTRYLARPVAPAVLGFDPRVQLLHEHDAVEVLVHAARTVRPRVPRAINVAGAGVLALSQVLRLAGAVRAPVPAVVLRATCGDAAARLRFAPVVDATRLVRDLGYRPRYTTLEALHAHLRVRPASAGPVPALSGVASAAVAGVARLVGAPW
jgi:UDP-glucose 4-epimerase